jgi:hypothetical protein
MAMSIGHCGEDRVAGESEDHGVGVERTQAAE